MNRITPPAVVYLPGMATNSTLLCIHHDPAQLSLLRENGYELVTATTGSDGLRLFMSRAVDAIVVEYQLGLLDGALVAAEIKSVRPEVPVVMLADDLELPDDALKFVDALVIKSDGVHFLLATVHFVLNVKPARRRERQAGARPTAHLRRTGRSREAVTPLGNAPPSTDENDEPFPLEVWQGILKGRVQF